MRVFKKEEITNVFLSKHVGRKCKIRYKHYSHHAHLESREGIIEEVSKDHFMVSWGEAASASSIHELTFLDEEAINNPEALLGALKSIVEIDNDLKLKGMPRERRELRLSEALTKAGNIAKEAIKKAKL